MAKFQVNTLSGYGPTISVCYQEKWWNPWGWKATHWRTPGLGGHAYVMVGKTLVRELRGHVRTEPYVFEADAPEGDVWTISVDGAICEVERLS